MSRSDASKVLLSQIAPIISNSLDNISHEEIVELQEKFREIKYTINNVLAVMMALSEMLQRRNHELDFLAVPNILKNSRARC